MVWRQYVRHDSSFGRCDVWRLSDDGRGLVVRFRLANGPEHILSRSFDELSLRQHDDATFLSVPLRVPDTLGRIEFAFCGAPDPVAEAVRQAVRPEGA